MLNLHYELQKVLCRKYNVFQYEDGDSAHTLLLLMVMMMMLMLLMMIMIMLMLLQVRSKTAAEVAEEEELLKKEAEKMASHGDGGEEDAFLQDFVGNRRWLDPHSKETPRWKYVQDITFSNDNK